MNLKKNFYPILAIILACGCLWLIIWLNTRYWHFRFSTGIFWIFSLPYVFAVTYLLYKRNFREVLALKTAGVTKKVIGKAILWGFLFGGASAIAVRLLSSHPMPVFDSKYPLYLLFAMIVMAPVMEEFFFRGFFQGLLQSVFGQNSGQPPSKIKQWFPIAITALLFSISHFAFSFRVQQDQFVILLVLIFFVGLYLGWLRQRYQSLVPSMVAHAFFNIGASVIGGLFVMVLLFTGNSGGEIKRELRKKAYSDSTTYHFDPNNLEVWQESVEKYALFHQQPLPALPKGHLRNNFTPVNLFFTLDTCGRIKDISLDTANYQLNYKGKVPIGYGVEEEAMRLLQSIPNPKPFLVDGKKQEKRMSGIIPIYGN